MIKTILLTAAVYVASVMTASAQLNPNTIKDCARTMTNDMRNCGGGGEQPEAREKAKQAGEAAQGREEEKSSCNQEALYSYYNCSYEGQGGRTKPVSTTPKVITPVAKSKKGTSAPKTIAPKVQN